ncbi:GNAT family N-acetyltransferase [Catenuloplanes atrovinosus]|uniref:GNAT superfamily N-acetyltransferase n=1 Tax=Catenuloplanes atrovinosus TaxID=137266 RepID=A0AAE4CDA0_9ACTN|nr:GNAT family N-acetyltransferase [Catenuloplanes atrovinosus]MDR7278834.1 GNAT superfamily N-acetyltransferase [Catenuloplanes atrovinosus]
MHPTITRAEASDAAWTTDLITRALEGHAPAVWLIPPRDRRHAILSRAIRTAVDAALVHGEVLCTPERNAVAVWLAHGAGDAWPTLPGRWDARVDAITAEFRDRFGRLATLLAAHHPAEPHHHLLFMAVEPNRRGEGLGSALLRAHHARLDAEGIPAYLVSGNPAARDLYARHGYRAADPLLLPDGAPFWPMWRPSRPGTPETTRN